MMLSFSPMLVMCAVMVVCSGDVRTQAIYGTAFTASIIVGCFMQWLEARERQGPTLVVWNGKDYHGVIMLRDKAE